MLGRLMRWVYFGIGICVLLLILENIDFNSVFDLLIMFGWLGFSVVVAVYLLAFWIDALSWLLAIDTAPVSWRWTWKVFAARMAGEAYNALIPAAGIGGEPIKAEILKRRFGVSLKVGGASLVIAKTVNMIALVAFLILGFVMILGVEGLSGSIKTLAGLGLATIVSSTATLFILQRYKLTSQVARRLANAINLDWIRRSLIHLDDIDQIFVSFYRYRGSRFRWSLSLAFINWLLGVVEIYVVMHFLGYPVDWTAAWIIEAATQLMRTAAFFIPAAIGVQEGTFLFICGLLTGNPTLGMATALIRRAREILWIILGLICAAALSTEKQ